MWAARESSNTSLLVDYVVSFVLSYLKHTVLTLIL